MRLFIVHTTLILFYLGFSSCSTYYYSTLATSQREVVKKDNGDFMQENDTVSISYCFYGENMPVEITVYNKLDKPLFLDWQQSSLVLDAMAIGYNRNAGTEEQTKSSTFAYMDYLHPQTNYAETFGHFAGQGSMPERVAFIPPQMMINSTPIVLNEFAFEDIPDNEFSKAKYAGNNGKMKNVRLLEFTDTNTPLRFRSYITLYTVNESGDRDKSMTFVQDFYLSQLVKSKALTPSNTPANLEQRGDFFYIRKEKISKLAVIAGTAAIGIAGGVAIGAAVTPSR